MSEFKLRDLKTKKSYVEVSKMPDGIPFYVDVERLVEWCEEQGIDFNMTGHIFEELKESGRVGMESTTGTWMFKTTMTKITER